MRNMQYKDYPLPTRIVATSAYVGSLLNRLLLFVPTVIFLFLFCLFVFNTSRGFDITDESFYLLWAGQPEHVLASATQFGYYTRLLYLLSGENIALFRGMGLVVLLGIAGFFAVALERYWMSLSGSVVNARMRWEITPFVLLCTLVYYGQWWLLTPSYNWLALCCTLFVAAGLLNAATKGITVQPRARFDIGLLTDAVFVGIGGGVAFMAKPTTALVLAVTAFFWVTIHYKNLRKQWLPFLALAAITACLVLHIHAFVFRGGIIPFYVHLREGINLGKILGGGHSTGALISQAINDLKQVPSRVFALSPIGFLLFPVVMLLVRWNKVRGREAVAIYLLTLFLFLFWVVIGYQLWSTGQLSKNGLGFAGIAILSVVVSSAFLARVTFNRKKSVLLEKSFLKVTGLCLFLFMLAAAYAFGSGNGLIRQMSAAYVFLVVGALYAAFWIENYVERTILANTISVAIAVSVLLASMKVYNRPYRLPVPISEQNVEVSCLARRGTLQVDKQTAEYIDGLKKVAMKAGWRPGTPLIDLTGGSPGAAVILGGRIMGTPWLLGHYKGSNEFAQTALGMSPESVQRSAWVLTAPHGKGKISDEILVQLGLDFPGGYVRLGEVKTGHRNEIQILWKPKGEE